MWSEGSCSYWMQGKDNQPFKQEDVTVEGQPVDVDPTCPNGKIVGKSNTSYVYLNNKICTSLLDSGSHVSTLGEKFYEEHLKDSCPLQPLEDLLVLTGAGGHNLPYHGFIVVDLYVPKISSSNST